MNREILDSASLLNDAGRCFYFKALTFDSMKAENVNDAWLASLAATLKMKLTKAQGNAVRLIVSECEKQGVTDLRQIAYVLGTVYHESRFRSIEEIRAQMGTSVYKMQQKYWPSGFYGRGFSQLTWRKNYQKFSPIVGLDLVKKPDLVLRPEIGAKILVYGMKHGTFVAAGLQSMTNLDKYFNAEKTDWFNARRIVNGVFRAEMVAEAAKKILPLLSSEPLA